MTIDEMKNKISMELRSTDTQLGFEVICKNLMEHEKVNAELKEKLDEYVNIVEDDEVKCVKLQEENEQLKYNLKCRDDELAESKAQIEKMKCCGNCKHWVHESIQKYCLLTSPNFLIKRQVDVCDKWELVE